MSLAGITSENSAAGNTVAEVKDAVHAGTPVREITIAHSPDSDDAFMFYALATNKVRVPGCALRIRFATSRP